MKRKSSNRKARDIYNSIGEISSAKILEANIANFKAQYGDGGAELSIELKDSRDVFEYCVQSEGEGSMNAMGYGMNLAQSLRQLGHGIESERLLLKFASISLRVYGREHDMAKRAASFLEVAKQRLVHIPPEAVVFEALQYDDAVGDQYIVKQARRREVDGDLIILRDSPNCETFTVPANGILWPAQGTPVVCHGLKNAAHLNGKIGDTRGYNAHTGRYEIHFEDKSLKPVAVKRENLRIVVELPAAVEHEGALPTAAAVTMTEATRATAAAAHTDEALAEEAAISLLAELDLEESEIKDTGSYILAIKEYLHMLIANTFQGPGSLSYVKNEK